MIDGGKLRAFREARNVTQAAVAEKLGISRSAVADMEGRTVGIEAAERYLNAAAEVYAERSGSLVVIRLDIVGSAASADREVADAVVVELQGLLS